MVQLHTSNIEMLVCGLADDQLVYLPGACSFTKNGMSEMPELANPLRKIRVQLDLSPAEARVMNWIMEVCSIETKKDLFNDALTLFQWAVEESVEGRKIASIDERTKERNFVNMRSLKTALSNEKQYDAAPTKRKA
jgi:hypothetical protein